MSKQARAKAFFSAALALAAAAVAFAQTPSAPSPEEMRGMISKLDSKLYFDRETARKGLAAAGSAAEGELVSGLLSGSDRRKEEIVRLLSAMKSSKAVPLMLDLFTDDPSDYDLRTALYEAFSAMPDVFGAELERKFPDDVQRGKIRRAVAEYRTEKFLLGLLSDDGGYGRFDGQFAGLKKIGPEAVPVLISMFTDTSFEFKMTEKSRARETLRIAACDALGELDDKSAVVPLGKAFEESWKMFISGASEEERAAAFAMADSCASAAFSLGSPEPLLKMEQHYFNLAKEETAKTPVTDAGWTRRLGVLGRHASILTRLKMTDGAIKAYKLMTEDILGLEKKLEGGRLNYSGPFYNLACLYSLQGDRRQALEHLYQAVAHGYDDDGWMEKDKDLDGIRGTQGFKDMLAAIRKSKKARKDAIY